MDTLKKHEVFEIEVLEALKNAKLLEPVIFGGGTMLRLCYELNRYSADLDFWVVKKIKTAVYFQKLKECLLGQYELTDAKIKFNSILLEIRSKDYPKRLKIEIRKGIKDCDTEERIAFSKYSLKQVILKVHSLKQTMKNKIEAALDRGEIRDFFDLEFLLRRGIPMELSKQQKNSLRTKIGKFKDRDFKVILGSILDPDMRQYYIKNKFNFLSEKLK
ncbi:MAG: nucleotidyl transferase AbiEii/AbiGii toxin family protein [Candidatus Omnitrophica bacterium]|nr:nucleotidyl transferase AbiEii/AbiGii toxin family protein [Candidatus Omnitrophota bacterium]